MMKFRARQAWAIARIEMRRAFLSKRAFWVYLLAILPAVIFIGHGIEMKIRESRYLGRGVTPPEVINSLREGDRLEAVLARAPKPVEDHEWKYRRPVREDQDDQDGSGQNASTKGANPSPAKAGPNDAAKAPAKAGVKPGVKPGEDAGEEPGENDHERRRDKPPKFERVEARSLTYYDGHRRVSTQFENGILTSKRSHTMKNFEEDRTVFAAVFQYFFLRLAIFFGCLGIFMNLFRGEMLDKTLHYWFLAPARREVLLLGKYLAGLTAAIVIFTGGAMLGFGAMMWSYSGPDVQAYWAGPGPAHLFWYAAAAALGCVGYGSVFVAAGLLLRNPIIPAAVLLVWESINNFLPDLLQKFSILYYLQSMCPVPAPIESDTPALLRLLVSPAAPASRGLAVLGLLAVTALVLWAASSAVKRIEINYGTE